LRPILAFDIETTGLDAWRDKITIRGIYDGKSYHCLRSPEQLRNLLCTVYKDYDIVGHRTDFDIKYILVQNEISEDVLKGRIIHDTRIIGSLLKNRVPKTYLDQYEEQRKLINKTLPKGQSHREGSPLSLKTMAPWYLKVPPFWETPGNHDNEEYNEKDCLYTYRLFKLLAPRLREEGSWDFYLKMLEWQQMLMRMEIKGISIDMNELDVVEKEYTEKRYHLRGLLDTLWADAHKRYGEMQEAEIASKYQQMAEAQITKGKNHDKVHKRYGELALKAIKQIEPFNYSSPTQMAWLLRDYLGLNITNMEGDESTSKAVLNKLASEGREDIKTYLEWREADKVLTMYLPTYRKLQVDGIIHPNFNLTGTRTGRTSSSGPNLQQVPSKLYRLFKPRVGSRFVSYDLSGIEAALIALYSGDKRLFEILEKGESFHDHNVHALLPLFGLPENFCEISEVASKLQRQRKCVKNIGFACFYGAGWRRISQVFAAGGFPITDEQAKFGLKLLKQRYPDAFAFHKEITETFERGETVINLLGRPINLQAHDNVYMTGFNTLIQSSASDLNIEACYRFYNTPNSQLAYPLLVIHDCVMAEADEHFSSVADKWLQQCMTEFNLNSIHGKIQLRVEGGVSDKWE